MKEIQQTLIIVLVLFTTMVSAQEPSLTLKGKVYDKQSEKGINQASVRLFDSRGATLKTTITDLQGDYHIKVESNSNQFKVEAQAEDYNQAEVFIDSSKKNIEINFGLNSKENIIEKVNFPVIYFDFDSSYLTGKAKEDLEQVVMFMKKNQTAKLRVNAHTDTRGSSIYNDWLSARRAERVRSWLIQDGKINANRIEEHHFGKTQLSNHCSDGVACTANQHRENRRCSLEIVYQ